MTQESCSADLLKRLKDCFEKLYECAFKDDIDQFEFMEIAQQYKLIKLYKAPDNDEFQIYMFPIWFGEQTIREHMQIERDQSMPEEIKD